MTPATRVPAVPRRSVPIHLTDRPPWTPVVTGPVAAATEAVVRTLAERLRAPASIHAAVQAAQQQTDHPRSVHWRAEGLWQGHAGLAVLWSQLDRAWPDEGWDTVAHEHLRLAAAAIEQRDRPEFGLSRGLGGLAAAALLASRHGTRYERLLVSVEHVLRTEVATAVAALAGRDRSGVPTSAFDVISGLSGVGRYLLLRRHDASCRRTLEAVLSTLVALTGAHEADGALPRWHTPADLLPAGPTRRAFPDGALNCGLAHGAPGPLALLSLGVTAGVLVDGQVDAIRRLSAWLEQARLEDDWGVTWPTMVPVIPASGPGGTVAEPVPSRTAWCYGSLGIVRALWLAGRALAEPRYEELAVAGLEAVHRRPPDRRHIDSPTICHGLAGLQQVTLRFAAETGSPAFVRVARDQHAQLLEAHEPDSRLGYRNLEPTGTRIDQPGLLDGAAGVALVLLAATTPVVPEWDAVLLLS